MQKQYEPSTAPALKSQLDVPLTSEAREDIETKVKMIVKVDNK